MGFLPDLPNSDIPDEQKVIAELDRNARAYGFEIGRGHPLTEKLTHISPDNPFMDRDWKSKITKEDN